MDVRPLKTEADYDWALAEARKYLASEPARGTPEGDRFEVLLALIENYETHHHARGTPEPIAAIKVRMEEKGITRRQLCSEAGITESKISEVLNYRRPLSLGMIRSLAPILDLPEAVLVPRYPLKGPARRTASGRTRRTRQSRTVVRKRALGAPQRWAASNKSELGTGSKRPYQTIGEPNCRSRNQSYAGSGSARRYSWRGWTRADGKSGPSVDDPMRKPEVRASKARR